MPHSIPLDHLCWQTVQRWVYPFGLQHPKGVHPPPCPPFPWQYANLHLDPHYQENHPWGWVLQYDWQCQGEDPRQGGHSARPAALDLCWQTAWEQLHSVMTMPTPYPFGPTPHSSLSTPMFLLLLQCSYFLLWRLAFLSCSCHSFRYIPCILLSPTCQSATLLPTYPFHVFPPFHVILLLRFLTLSHGLTSGNWGRDDISWYTL